MYQLGPGYLLANGAVHRLHRRSACLPCLEQFSFERAQLLGLGRLHLGILFFHAFNRRAVFLFQVIDLLIPLELGIFLLQALVLVPALFGDSALVDGQLILKLAHVFSPVLHGPLVPQGLHLIVKGLSGLGNLIAEVGQRVVQLLLPVFVDLHFRQINVPKNLLLIGGIRFGVLLPHLVDPAAQGALRRLAPVHKINAIHILLLLIPLKIRFPFTVFRVDGIHFRLGDLRVKRNLDHILLVS